MCIDEGFNKLYVGRKVVIVIEFTPPRPKGEKSKIQNWALFWNIYGSGSGKSNILSTDIDLDTLPKCPGICALTHK